MTTGLARWLEDGMCPSCLLMCGYHEADCLEGVPMYETELMDLADQTNKRVDEVRKIFLDRLGHTESSSQVKRVECWMYYQLDEERRLHRAAVAKLKRAYGKPVESEQRVLP